MQRAGAEPCAGAHGGDIVVATRYYGRTGVDLARLQAWCARAQRYVGVARVLVAVRGDVDVTIEPSTRIGDADAACAPVLVLDVRPWHGVTDALNALMHEAVQIGAKRLVYMSYLVDACAEDVARVARAVDDATLVAGPAFGGMLGGAVPGHVYALGRHTATALRVPWNAFACWRLDALAVTGFCAAADQPCNAHTCADGSACEPCPQADGVGGAGVEESVTISVLQQLTGGRATAAKLLRLDAPGLVFTPRGPRRADARASAPSRDGAAFRLDDAALAERNDALAGEENEADAHAHAIAHICRAGITVGVVEHVQG